MVGAYIHDIKQLMAQNNRCWFEHIPWTANKLAHIISIETLKKKNAIYLVENVPEYAENLKEWEKEREPGWRQNRRWEGRERLKCKNQKGLGEWPHWGSENV